MNHRFDRRPRGRGIPDRESAAFLFVRTATATESTTQQYGSHKPPPPELITPHKEVTAVTIEATCPRTSPADLLTDELEFHFACVEDALVAGLALPCQDHDPDLFFADSPVEVERAKTLCADCPVKAVCLAAALERREPWGVWGGEWFEGGEAVGRKRPRGRPRKDGSIGPRPAPARVHTRTKEVAA